MRTSLRILILLCSPVSVAFAAPATPARPNIVLIVSDDQGYGDSTAYQKTDLQTPAMEELARGGIRFTQFRVNPLCAPTRASVMTGLYSVENGMWRGPSAGAGEEEEDGKKKAVKSKNPKKAAKAAKAAAEGEEPNRERRFIDGLQLMPQYLKAAGYATGMFGKWHLGYDAQNVPNARGFDEFVGFLGGAHPYLLSNNSRILRNGKPLVVPDGHTTDVFADHAIAFIKANQNRPFFCYVPFNAVHGPLHRADAPRNSARPEWLEFYEKRGVPQPRRDYNAVMTHADKRMGDILATLRELGLEKNTLVIFHSDNGGILHSYPSNNGPLRGGKGDGYEGGIRVPALMKWPAVIPAGSVSNASAVHFDLFSTVLDAAGIKVPATNGNIPVRGVSLLPHVKSGGKTPLPDRYLFWDLYGSVAAAHGDWKLVGEMDNHRGRFDEAAKNAAAATFELYNLKDDLGEKTDLREKHPEVYKDLKDRHVAWLKSLKN